jgi:division protein CdvB (Snf7/Vps24/ESCRT-III family)
MMNMNRQMKLPEIQKIMQEFEKQSEIMDMKEEMMNDVIGKEALQRDVINFLVDYCSLHLWDEHFLIRTETKNIPEVGNRNMFVLHVWLAGWPSQD